jgi:hypothetical protein
MNTMMSCLLSTRGYDNYRLASGQAGVLGTTNARFKHLVQVLPAYGFAAGVTGGVLFTYSTTNSEYILNKYTPPFMKVWDAMSPYLFENPSSGVFDYLRENFEALCGNTQVRVRVASLLGAGVCAIALKGQTWTSIKENARGVWDPTRVAKENYRKELWALLPKIALVAAALLFVVRGALSIVYAGGVAVGLTALAYAAQGALRK